MTTTTTTTRYDDDDDDDGGGGDDGNMTSLIGMHNIIGHHIINTMIGCDSNQSAARSAQEHMYTDSCSDYCDPRL